MVVKVSVISLIDEDGLYFCLFNKVIMLLNYSRFLSTADKTFSIKYKKGVLSSTVGARRALPKERVRLGRTDVGGA